MVTFAAGYIAGVFCAIVSHPADSVVSVINKSPEKSAGQSKSKSSPKLFILREYSTLIWSNPAD